MHTLLHMQAVVLGKYIIQAIDDPNIIRLALANQRDCYTVEILHSMMYSTT